MDDFEYMDRETQETYAKFVLVSLLSASVICAGIIYAVYKITSVCFIV